MKMGIRRRPQQLNPPSVDTSVEQPSDAEHELAAARQRIAELEEELAMLNTPDQA